MAGFFRKDITVFCVDCTNDNYWYEFIDPNVFNRLNAINGIERIRHEDKIYRILEIVADISKNAETDAIIYLKYDVEYASHYFKLLKDVKEGTDRLSIADKEAAKWEARLKAEDGFCIPV